MSEGPARKLEFFNSVDDRKNNPTGAIAQTRLLTARSVLLGIWLLLAIAGHCAAQDKDLLHRDRLTGNWGGARTKLEENGVSLQVDWRYNEGNVDMILGGAKVRSEDFNMSVISLLLGLQHHF